MRQFSLIFLTIFALTGCIADCMHNFAYRGTVTANDYLLHDSLVIRFDNLGDIIFKMRGKILSDTCIIDDSGSFQVKGDFLTACGSDENIFTSLDSLSFQIVHRDSIIQTGKFCILDLNRQYSDSSYFTTLTFPTINVKDEFIRTDFPCPVDVKKLKQNPKIIPTSKQIEIETTPHNKLAGSGVSGFWREYLFVKNPKTGLRDSLNKLTLNILKVYVPVHRERAINYDDNLDIFSEITLKTNDIKVWDSISVGTNQQDLLKFIGKNIHYKKGTVIHSELGVYSADFTILGDTVHSLTVGKYRKFLKIN